MFPKLFHKAERFALFALSVAAAAQTPSPVLTLQQAEDTAIKNHPQIQAAQNEVNFANQQILINRSAYYPDVNADITGTQGNNLSRLSP